MGASCLCSTILFGILAGIGVFVMVVVGSIVVKEYNLAKSFQPTECRLRDVADLGLQTCEYCYTTYTSTRRNGRRTTKSKRKCRPSSFPCVRLMVSFYDNFRSNHSATYFPDAMEMSQSLLCSFFNCGPSFTSNEIQVRNRVRHFMDTHKHPFTCFYSTLHPGRIIIQLVPLTDLIYDKKPAEIPTTVELATTHGSRLSVIRDDDYSGGATGGSANPEKVPLTAPQGGLQVLNPPQSYNPSAPTPYLPPIGFISYDDAAYLPQQQGHGSDRMYPHMHQAPYPGPNTGGPIHPTMTSPIPGTNTMYPPPQQTDSTQPSAPPPSYNSVCVTGRL